MSWPEGDFAWVRLGAARGAAVFGTYALAEIFVLEIAPGAAHRLRPELEYQPFHPAFTAALLSAAAAAGALAGGALGAGLSALARRAASVRRADPGALVAGLAGAVLVAAAALNLIWAGRLGAAAAAVLATAGGITALGIAGAYARRARVRRVAGAAPLAAAAALAGLLALALLWPDGPRILQAGAAATPLAALLTLIWVARPRGARRGDAGAQTRGPGRPPAHWTRRRGPAFVAAGLAAVGLSALMSRLPPPPFPAAGAGHAPAGAAPVILIVLDTVRADHLSLYGYPRETDPNLRALATHATLYTRAIAPGAMTLSSHASLFTGRWASRHGAHFDPAGLDEALPSAPPVPLAPRFETLAERLRAAGYATLAVVSNYGFLGRDFGLDQGFQHYDARPGAPLLRYAGPFHLREPLRRAARALLPSRASWRWRDAGEITRAALALLDRAAADERPFLLFLNYMDVHRPIVPPASFRDRFPGRLPRFDWERDYAALRRGVLRGTRALGAAERAHLTSQYDAALAFLDAELGRLFTRLRALGLYDASLLIVTSDHGEAFGEKGTFGHGASVAQAVVHVPLLIKRPGQRAPRVVDTPVSLVDLLPTVLEVVGLPVPDGADGQSLLAGAAPRPIVSESFPDTALARLDGRFLRVERAVFAGDDKLVTSTAGGRELYDLARDPAERSDLAADRPERVRDLAALLDGQLGSAAGHAPGVDDDALERLRALGYLE